MQKIISKSFSNTHTKNVYNYVNNVDVDCFIGEIKLYHCLYRITQYADP